MDNWITVPLTTFVNDRHLDTAHARAGPVSYTHLTLPTTPYV